MITFVRSVIASAMASGEILKVRSSTSTKTGTRPNKTAASAAAAYVNAGTITSSPRFKFKRIKAICKASVQFPQGITYSVSK